MPTVTPSVYRRFHKYCQSSVGAPARLAPDEVFVDSFNDINIKIPDTFTILEGDVRVPLMGQTEATVRQTFCGDSISQALKKAKTAGAVNLSVLLG